VVGIVEEREASQKNEELPALALVYWFLFMDTSRAAALAKWNAMSYLQKSRVARKASGFAVFLSVSVMAYLEYLFDLNPHWSILSFIPIFACLYYFARWRGQQRRLTAG
jgi:uncharacterized membrane protein